MGNRKQIDVHQGRFQCYASSVRSFGFRMTLARLYALLKPEIVRRVGLGGFTGS